MVRSVLRRLPALLTFLAVLAAASLAVGAGTAGATGGPAPLLWRPGAVVPTFGTGGTVRLAPPSAPHRSERLAVDAAGDVLVLIQTEEGGSFLTRLLPDGAADPEFAGGGWLRTPPGEWVDLALDPEGRILLAGSVEGDSAVARLNPDGTPDPSFGSDGVARLNGALPTSGPYVRRGLTRLVALPDGGVLAVGSIGFCAGPDCSEASGVVVKLTAAGTLDPSFADGGVDVLARAPRIQPGHGRGVMREASALAVQPDGKVLVGGTDSRTVVVDRLTATGALDTTFGDHGIFFTNRETEGDDELRGGGEGIFYPGSATSILVERSGEIVVVGIRLMYRLRPDGRLDPRFGYQHSGANWRGVSGSGPSSEQADALLDGAGRIIVVGLLEGRKPGVSRFLPDDQADGRFGAGGFTEVRLGIAPGYEPQWTSVGRLPGGELVMGGLGLFDRKSPHLEGVVRVRNDRDGHFAYCDGQRADYQGTPRSDRGIGWGTVVTFGGNDKIVGAGGTVCAGPGNDFVRDWINVGKGEPIYLGPGNDRAIHFDGYIFGGPGNDILVAGEEVEGDVLRGGPGDDVLVGGPEVVLIGGPGHDRIVRRPAPPDIRDR